MTAPASPPTIEVETTDAPLTPAAIEAWARVVWSAMEREAEQPKEGNQAA